MPHGHRGDNRHHDAAPAPAATPSAAPSAAALAGADPWAVGLRAVLRGAQAAAQRAEPGVDRQIIGQLGEIAPGPARVRDGHPLVELLLRQPALGVLTRGESRRRVPCPDPMRGSRGQSSSDGPPHLHMAPAQPRLSTSLCAPASGPASTGGGSRPTPPGAGAAPPGGRLGRSASGEHAARAAAGAARNCAGSSRAG